MKRIGMLWIEFKDATIFMKRWMKDEWKVSEGWIDWMCAHTHTRVFWNKDTHLLLLNCGSLHCMHTLSFLYDVSLNTCFILYLFYLTSHCIHASSFASQLWVSQHAYFVVRFSMIPALNTHILFARILYPSLLDRRWPRKNEGNVLSFSVFTFTKSCWDR